MRKRARWWSLNRASTLVVATSMTAMTIVASTSGAAADAGSASWRSVASAPLADPPDAAVALGDGTVLALGGTSPTADAAIFDPVSGRWSDAPPLHAARTGMTATLLADGRVLAIGSARADGAGGDAEVYDPEARAWSAAGDPGAHAGHTATLLQDGRVLVTGVGEPTGDATTATAIYDPASNAWTPAAPMSAPHGAGTAAAALHDGRVLVTGSGVDAEIYDPASDTWTPTPANTVRSTAAASVVPDGRVVVVGPAGALGGLPEIFDPASGQWSYPDNPNAYGRPLRPVAVTLSDGRVLVNEAYSETATAIFDPATSTWSVGPSFRIPTQPTAATVLDDTRLLVLGDVGMVSASTQVYLPNQVLAPDPDLRAGAPQELRAAPGPVEHSVDVSWTAPSNGTPTRYRVYRDGRLIDEVDPETMRFVDLDVIGTHRYWVTSINDAGESEPSTWDSGESAERPTAPELLSLWDDGHGCVGLGVYGPFDQLPIIGRRVYRGSSPSQLAPVADGLTDCTAQFGVTYYYAASAVNRIGEGPLSNIRSITPSLDITVDASQRSGTTTPVALTAGTAYRIDVSGTFTYDPLNNSADAQCAQLSGTTPFAPRPYSIGGTASTNILHLRVQGEDRAWQPRNDDGRGCDARHEYTMTYTPTQTQAVQFAIYDVTYGDNRGVLDVTITRLT